MKRVCFVIMTILVLSCNKTEVNEPESTLIHLNYPQGYGQSGDSLTSTVGFGYDATGICDTLSVKSKILNLNNLNHLSIAQPNYSGPGVIIGGNSYSDLLWNIENYPNKVDESTISFLSNIKSLLNFALNSDTIDNSCAYAYYSYYLIDKHIHYFVNTIDLESELTEGFKYDINVLTPEEIISKYGTHVIIDASTGSKFEVLYKCELKNKYSGDVLNLFYKRMNEYFGQPPGILINETNDNYLQSNELLLFNTLGFHEKLFGLINATNNNSNKITINLNDIFSSGSCYQFVKIGKDGLIPLYEFISNTDRKMALKELIDKTTSR